MCSLVAQEWQSRLVESLQDSLPCRAPEKGGIPGICSEGNCYNNSVQDTKLVTRHWCDAFTWKTLP